MNFPDWYTDVMDIYRVVQDKSSAVVRNSKKCMYKNIPCRIYQDSTPTPSMKRQAADYTQTMKIACKNDVDIREGDELTITRGGRLGYTSEVSRAFAGPPHKYYEPFGAVMPGLEHQEIALLQMERINGLSDSDQNGNS